MLRQKWRQPRGWVRRPPLPTEVRELALRPHGTAASLSKLGLSVSPTSIRRLLAACGLGRRRVAPARGPCPYVYSGGCKARCISAAAVARRDVYRRRLQGDPSARGSSWRATADPYAATTRTDCQRSAAKLVLGTPQVIWDPSRPTSLTLDAIDDGLDWSPYEGFEVPGRVRDVLARGSHFVADGQLTDIGHSGCISRSSAFSRMSGGKR